MVSKYRVVKYLYKEDELVTNVTLYDIDSWRHNNLNMQVNRPDHRPDLSPMPNPDLTLNQPFKNYPEILEEIYKHGSKQPSAVQKSDQAHGSKQPSTVQKSVQAHGSKQPSPVQKSVQADNT